MSYKSWQVIKTCNCHHINQQVGLEAKLVYPAEWLPEQAPCVLAHRCSQAVGCNLDGRSGCLWAGTNPAFDPFLEAL